MLQGKQRHVFESTWASSGRARWAALPSVLCPHPLSLNYCGWTPASRSTSVHYYIQCVKHRGPEGFQRNAPLNRTCRVNGLCVHTSECMCVYRGGVFVWWRDTRKDKYQQCNYTPDTLASSTCASLPSSLRCRPSPLIGPRGPCACVWGEVSIRVITPGPVQLTPTPTLHWSPTGQQGFLHQPAPAPFLDSLTLYFAPQLLDW